MRLFKLSALLALTLLFAGCSHTPAAPPHVGAINQFDSSMGDRLSEAQASILKAQDNEKSGLWPASWKPEVNRATQLYDVALQSYLAYRDVALGKKTGDPVALQALATKDLQAVADAVAALFAKGH